ncbi:hypothetical protein AYM40_07375 [Paraburkholderia phytofirmans OLGA172]|uniref:Uncharacterized protein n=1 Tax=Paraburkholderia phytofirmans OLGA172 TaxID=1417228 RepID=A0A160FJ21_9BURK|nr:hypothetical protein AYM40_07375 [Paraburkholderia phytofirmans OLGA172]
MCGAAERYSGQLVEAVVDRLRMHRRDEIRRRALCARALNRLAAQLTSCGTEVVDAFGKEFSASGVPSRAAFALTATDDAVLRVIAVHYGPTLFANPALSFVVRILSPSPTIFVRRTMWCDSPSDEAAARVLNEAMPDLERLAEKHADVFMVDARVALASANFNGVGQKTSH